MDLSNPSGLLFFGAREMTQQLRALAVLSEDLSSVSSTHVRLTNSGCTGANALSGVSGYPHIHVCTHIHTNKIYLKKFRQGLTV